MKRIWSRWYGGKKKLITVYIRYNEEEDQYYHRQSLGEMEFPSNRRYSWFGYLGLIWGLWGYINMNEEG